MDGCIETRWREGGMDLETNDGRRKVLTLPQKWVYSDVLNICIPVCVASTHTGTPPTHAHSHTTPHQHVTHTKYTHTQNTRSSLQEWGCNLFDPNFFKYDNFLVCAFCFTLSHTYLTILHHASPQSSRKKAVAHKGSVPKEDRGRRGPPTVANM